MQLAATHHESSADHTPLIKRYTQEYALDQATKVRAEELYFDFINRMHKKSIPPQVRAE